MAKHKQSEEDTNKPYYGVVGDSSARQADEVTKDIFVDGWIIGEAATEEGVSDPIITVEVEPEGEDGWEAEAFWALLTRAGYQLW